MAIRWALLGPGRHAERSVVAALKAAAGGELVALFSRDPSRGESFARAHGIPRVYTAFEELLRDRDIDALYDATPDGLHAAHAIAAARAGKHALIEKPLAISVAEGAAAIAAARRHNVKLGVVFNQRHEAVHQEARRLLRDGALGEVKLALVQIPLQRTIRVAAPASPQANWRVDPQMRPGGIAVSIGDHAYDTLAYILGQEIAEVSAFTDASRMDPPNEQVAAMLLKLAHGTIGYATASFATPFARRPFEFHGTKGSLIVENSYTYLTGADGGARPKLTLINEAGSKAQDFAPTDCFRLEIERFNRAIAGAGEPMTTAAEGLRSLAIASALYAAIREGRVAQIAEFMPQSE